MLEGHAYGIQRINNNLSDLKEVMDDQKSEKTPPLRRVLEAGVGLHLARIVTVTVYLASPNFVFFPKLVEGMM